MRDIDRRDADQLAAAYRELFLAAGGGALGLFTAVKTLRMTHARLVASERRYRSIFDNTQVSILQQDW